MAVSKYVGECHVERIDVMKKTERIDRKANNTNIPMPAKFLMHPSTWNFCWPDIQWH